MNKKVTTFAIAILLALCTGVTGFYAGKAQPGRENNR